MKAIEILSENKKLKEGPANMLGQAAKRIGAGVLGAAGLKTWAGQLNDKADIGTFANRYYREFQKYLQANGKTEDVATLGDLKTFMNKAGIPAHNVPSNPRGSANKDMVFAILNKTAEEKVNKEEPASTAPADEPADPASTAPASSGTAPRQQSQPTASGITPNQPFSVPALLQVIPQMNKRDLNKILSATQTALQNPKLAAKKAATVTTTAPTANMTPAQIRATKQAAAANVAQAQMKANPAPSKPAAEPTPAEIRQQKQAAAAQNAQQQMAPFSKTEPAPAVWRDGRTGASRRSPTKPKKAVAV